LFICYIVLKQIIKISLRILNYLLVFLSIALIFISIFKKDWLELVIEWMRLKISILWYWNYLIALLSSCIEAFPVLWWFLPWTNILLIVGWFFWQVNKFNLVYLIIFASIWAIFWNYFWYLLWQKYWDIFFEKYWLRVWIWRTESKYLRKWIEKWWAWWIILWKFHATTRTFLPFIAGATWMKSSKFMLYNAIGSIIRSILVVVLWVIFVNYYKIILNYAWYIFTWILLIIFWYIYLYKKEEFLKYMEEKNKEIEEMTNKK
jgi:membrane-associated protein